MSIDGHFFYSIILTHILDKNVGGSYSFPYWIVWPLFLCILYIVYWYIAYCLPWERYFIPGKCYLTVLIFQGDIEIIVF